MNSIAYQMSLSYVVTIWKKILKKSSLHSILTLFKLFSTVTFPTRIFKDTSIQIDNIYVNVYKFDFSVYPVINGLSDHDAQIIAFTDTSTCNPKQSISLTKKIDDNIIRNFVHQLSYENLETFFTEDVNIIYNNFVNTYVRIFYINFPLIKIKKFTKLKTMVN